MTRGDQRERARERNSKKNVGKNSGTQLPEGVNLAQKKALDAEIMRQKQQKTPLEKQHK
jgi:hypothetical protein